MKNIKSGFTLPELLITLGIVAIVSAMIIPGIQKMTSRSLNQVKADKIAGQLQNGFMSLFQDVMTNQANNNGSDAGYVERLTDIMRRDFSSNQSNSDNIKTTNKYFSSTCFGEDTNGERTFGQFLQSSFAVPSLHGGIINGGNELMWFFPAFGVEEIDDNNPLPATYYTDLSNRVTPVANDISNIADANGNSNIGDYFITRVKKDKALVIFERMSPIRSFDDTTITLFRVIIDVNGEQGPNILHDADNPNGDIFIYGVANNGNIHPAGSAAFANNVWSIPR